MPEEAMASHQKAYDAGKVEGKTQEILDRHELHLRDINGSGRKTVEQLAKIELLLQQAIDLASSRADALEREMKARDEKVLAVADALEKTETMRRNNTTAKWDPVTRMSVIGGFIVALIVAVVTIYVTTR